MSRWVGWQRTARVILALLAGGGPGVGLDAATGASEGLRWDRRGAGLTPHLSYGAGEGEVVAIQTSRDLARWDELLVGHGALEGVADLREPAPESSFYRAVVRPRMATDDGKNVIRDLEEAFRSPAGDPWEGRVRWVKFALLLDAPHRVWFQDSTKHTFHYEFGVARLPGFAGMTRAEFDAVTLRTNGQKAVLGAVVFPPTPSIGEVGVQFVGLDAYPREQVARWFETVRAMIQRRPEVKVVYLPTFEQADVARLHAAWFAERGIEVSGAGRWVVGDECYAPGWAMGRLVYVPPEGIEVAYRAGRLLPNDLLLTDQVPAEVPPLAGIIARVPATPNSHVALLAQSFGIPFVHLADAAIRERVTGWTNREVIVRAVAEYGGCDLTVEAVDGEMEPAIREAILGLKAPPKLLLPPKRVAGQVVVLAETLRPADIGTVGGKAANFGLLRRRIPGHSPSPALALTFDLWDGYLDQEMPGGGRLRDAIAERLTGFAWPPDMAAVQTALAEIREWITDTADFGAVQRAAVLKGLQDAGFEPTLPIRFRSSTNVEDSERFSGAGLYDSFSGCLADELDGDSSGPSRCDPTEPKERGVFRALRKVFASFYNQNAYLERLRHGVEETGVGMAVLVHPSTPDALEWANGVGTLQVSKEGGRYVSGRLVTQAGAVSVTNPETTAVPEEVSMFFFGATPSLTLERESSLVPLGGRVMTWQSDYVALANLLNLGAQAYEAEFPGRRRFQLDFEYKKQAPDGRLMVKQIREVPELADRTFAPWLVATAPQYEVFQGEHGDIVAHHRLKSQWSFRLRTTGLTDADLERTPYTEWGASWREASRPVERRGAPAEWPGYGYRRGSEFLSETWVTGEAEGRRGWELRTFRPWARTSREGPLVTLEDFRLELTARYAVPQPTLGYRPETQDYGPSTTLEETVWLGPVSAVTAESLRQERLIRVGGVTVRTAFWWPAAPKGPSAGYTAPVQGWIETRITGLASGDLRLRSPWAQTYHPGHHNFYEEFLFEPGLDPEVPGELLEELRARNIRAVVVGAPNGDIGAAVGFLWGLDGQFRKL